MTGPSAPGRSVGRGAAPARRRRPLRPGIEGVAVVVPVHDEEELLAGCLASLHAALQHPAIRPLRSTVVVVLDACADDSPAIADRMRRPGDHVVAVDGRNVGAARSTGCDLALAALGDDPSRIWLATTDADTRVPPHWLARQLTFAVEADAVAGVVRVDDWSAHAPSTRRRYARSYRGSPFRPHPHVHGATLGVRGSAYLDVGGFPPLACHEDHALWNALRAAGHPTLASRRVWVTTSARREARASGGFGDTLLAIERRAG